MKTKGSIFLAQSWRPQFKNFPPCCKCKVSLTPHSFYHLNEEILSTHFDISNAFTTYFSNIFGASHYPLLHATGIIMSGLIGTLRVPSTRRRLELQCLVLAPKKLQDQMDSLLYSFKGFGILSRWIFFYCSISYTLDPRIFVTLTILW